MHGTVGAGLARLRLNELAPEPALLAEAAAALQASVAAADRELSGGAPPFGLTVCHGLGGTLELLATAADTLGEGEHRATAQWLLDRAIAWLGADPEQWPSGVEGCSWAPGLMIGMAGTMLVLLRLARPGAAAPGVGLLLAGSDRP